VFSQLLIWAEKTRSRSNGVVFLFSS